MYLVYGSHDFSPTQTSIIDLLESVGLSKKVTKGKIVHGRLELEFRVDERTKAKLCGVSGRRLSIEEYYEILNREALEKEEGFKIFAFHGALSEYKPKYAADADSIPLSNLPKGFDYYAGGHVREKVLGKEYGYKIAYSVTLFGADYRDLEASALRRSSLVMGASIQVRHVNTCNRIFANPSRSKLNHLHQQPSLIVDKNRKGPKGSLSFTFLSECTLSTFALL